ncbi:MAG TPA: FTR1 family protein, partial [Burkholderiales bacterium]|nr:FTR1 family protein [Burkholderiales bacterium]
MIVHLLDYVGADYAGAVNHGRIKSGDEYHEMLEFSAQVVEQVEKLPSRPGKASLTSEAAHLQQLVARKAEAKAVADVSSKLRWAIVDAYRIPVAPQRPPDLSAAANLYGQRCVMCHGAQGRGDGPAAKNLDPPPTNFQDHEHMAARSPYSAYNSITLGVAGTAMRAFPEVSDDDRWALAFLVSGFGNVASRELGEKIWKDSGGKHAPNDIVSIATLSPNQVKEKFGADAIAVQAYLLAHPELAASGTSSPIAFSLRMLEDAHVAYRAGEIGQAQQLAITAYLEGFELVEAALRNVDAQLMSETEREMMALRSLLARGAPLAEVEKQHGIVVDLLTRADARLSGARLSPAATFTSALLILLREGLEAILVLAAIIAFLVKTGRRDALPYIHAGWVTAIVLGIATWFAATSLIRISGASREVTEGVTALIAVAILIYVGFWLHGKAQAQRWQHFVHRQVSGALNGRTLWAMALVSFLAVYREMFETVLFYETLWAQVGDQTRHALFGGISTAIALLFGAAWAVFKYSVRLPIRWFFSVTAGLLALLAVV